MDVKQKKCKIWRKEVPGRNGTFYRYSVSISSKNEDGSHDTVYLPIRFAKRANMPEKIKNGAECDFEGFLSVDAYTDREGNRVKSLQIIAMKAVLTDGGDPSEGADSFEQLEEDLPFK